MSTHCPICGGTDLRELRRNDVNFVLLVCRNCGGVPAECHGQRYVHFGNSPYRDCERCGERGASINTHSLLVAY